MLPVATRTNIGIYASAQSFEQLLLRMRGRPLPRCGRAPTHAGRARKVIPAFLTRVDVPDRGGAWTEYLSATRAATSAIAAEVLGDAQPEPRPEVTLTEWDPRRR